MAMTFSLLTGAGTGLPACGSRAPGADAAGCKSGSAVKRSERIGPALEVAGVDEFVLQAAPQALDENVVQSTATSIHADGDVALL